MAQLPTYLSDENFKRYVLPHLTHKIGHNRQKVSYAYVFNAILFVLKSGCSWRTLRPENSLITWQNVYYHYNKWVKDGSFQQLADCKSAFESTHTHQEIKLALECIQLDGTHTPAKKGASK
ncbi:MAG: transposase [Bacteroidetes Order II. Incertae sedis bacterium]|nr:transposase [Bacteroidetes Order II. bacterium]